MENSDLRQRTARGFMWGFLNNGSMQLLGAVFGIILLRLLTQEDYGKIAMLMVFSQIASALQESGFTQALCNLGHPTHRDYNSVFWCNIGISFFLYVLLFFSAPAIARFYHDPSLVWLARYLFLGFFISSWGCVQNAWLFIHMKNREMAIIMMVAMLVSSLVGVGMALLGFAYWGLATQSILFILVTAILRWHYSPWRPTPTFDFRPARRMFGFGSRLLLTNLFLQLNLHAFSVLLGRYFGDRLAGVYANARKWCDMGANTINGMVSGVAQPVLTQVRTDRERYCQVTRKMLRFISFISFPSMLGMGLVSREFLLVTVGPKWEESAELMSLLCIYGAFYPIATLYTQLTISMGRSGVNLFSTMFQCFTIWGGLIALHDMGLRWMVVYFVCVNMSWLLVWQWWAHKLVGLRLWHVVLDVAPFLVFTLLVLGFTWWATLPLRHMPLVLLLSRIALAAVLYAGIMWLSGAKIMKESIDYLRHKQTD